MERPVRSLWRDPPDAEHELVAGAPGLGYYGPDQGPGVVGRVGDVQGQRGRAVQGYEVEDLAGGVPVSAVTRRLP